MSVDVHGHHLVILLSPGAYTIEQDAPIKLEQRVRAAIEATVPPNTIRWHVAKTLTPSQANGIDLFYAVYQMTFIGQPSLEQTIPESWHTALRELSVAPGVDLCLLPSALYYDPHNGSAERPLRYAFFDMDSTLIQQEVIDEIAREAHCFDQVAAITEEAMAGKLDFKQSLMARVALLKDLPVSRLANILSRLTLMPGAKALVQTLKSKGWRTTILSGGFTYFGEHIRQELSIDAVFANTLEIDPIAQTLTGNVTGMIVDAEQKARLVQKLAADAGIPLSQVMCVGDGANDIPMLKQAALGIAFNAKPKVQEQVTVRVNQPSLQAIECLIGLSD